MSELDYDPNKVLAVIEELESKSHLFNDRDLEAILLAREEIQAGKEVSRAIFVKLSMLSMRLRKLRR